MDSIEEVKQAIQQVEAQRSILGEAATSAALEGLREKLKNFQNQRQSQSQERKQVTILFADICDFTALSESLDHEEVMNLVNQLWKRLDQVILKFGGRVNQHIGDAVMALFGIPVAREDDPERAVSAALAMKEEIKAYLQELKGEAPDLKIRIGLDTGLVSLGKMGTTNEYTAIGDAVNLAGSLEKAAPKGEILISHQLYSHVVGIFTVQKLEPIEVEGKPAPIQVYLVKKKKPRAFRVLKRRVEGIETPIIGREKEFLHLQNSLKSVVKKQSLHMVTLVGEAGVGKSRLLYEFDQWGELHSTEFWFWRGRAVQNGQNSTYFLIRMLFELRFEIQEGENQENAKEKLVQGIMEQTGEIGGKYAHFIGHLLGFDFTASPYLKGILNNPKQIQQQAFWLSVQLFQTMSRNDPLVFYLEDLHWADQGSLEWLSYLLKHCSSLPLLFIVTCRPNFLIDHLSWGENLENSSRLFLDLLSKMDSQRLVQAILYKVAEVPLELQNLILEKSEGSPFCIEELIKMFLEERVICKINEQEWQVNLARLNYLKVPSTLIGVLQARFDSLNPQEKEVLYCASVIGRFFWDQAIHFLREDSTDVHNLLEDLCQKEMLFLREESIVAGCREYLFKHGLLQEVVYESVLQSNRRKYHQRVALWMEERNGAANIIARHYELAQNKEQAALWYIKSGRRAKESCSLPEANFFFNLALSLFSHLEKYQTEQMFCHAELGEIMSWQAQFEPAKQHLQNLLQLAEKNQNVIYQSQSLSQLSYIHVKEGNYSISLDYVEQAVKILEEAGLTQQKEYASCLRRKAIALYRLDKPLEDSLSLLQQSIMICTEVQDLQGQADTYNNIGITHLVGGNWKEAESALLQGLKIFESLENQEGVSGIFLNLGELYRLLGNATMSLECCQKCLYIAQKNHLQRYEFVCFNNIAGAYLELEKYALAEEKALQALAFTSDSWDIHSETYNFLSQSYLGQGKWEESFSAAQKALTLSQDSQDSAHLGQAWETLGRVATTSQNFLILEEKEYSSDFCFDRSICIFQGAKMEAHQAKTLYLWALHQWQSGKIGEAQIKWEEAKRLFTKLDMPLYLEKMRSWPPQK